jgi:hypothetical protein
MVGLFKSLLLGDTTEINTYSMALVGELYKEYWFVWIALASIKI